MAALKGDADKCVQNNISVALVEVSRVGPSRYDVDGKEQIDPLSSDPFRCFLSTVCVISCGCLLCWSVDIRKETLYTEGKSQFLVIS